MKCPKCKKKGTLYLQSMYQIGLEQKVLNNGKLSKRIKKTKPMSEDWSLVYCSDCGFCTNSNQWTSYRFVDGVLVIDEDLYE